jgi:hypothetical protein
VETKRGEEEKGGEKVGMKIKRKRRKKRERGARGRN